MKKFFIIKILLMILIPNYIFAKDDSAKNIIKYGENFTVAENEKYNNITVFGGNVTVSGQVNDIAVFGGDLTINKTADITGEVNLYGGELILVEGTSKPNNYNQIPVQSKLISTLLSPEVIATSFEAKNLIKFSLNITKNALFIILGLICLWFFEKSINNITIGIKTKPLMTPVYGLLAWISFSPILILLIVSILGVVLIPFLILFYFISIIFGWTAISLIIGQACIARWKPELNIYALFFCGSIIAMILCAIPIISLIISIIGALYALGAVVITKFGQRHIYG